MKAAFAAMGAEGWMIFWVHHEALTGALERAMEHGEGEDERTN